MPIVTPAQINSKTCVGATSPPSAGNVGAAVGVGIGVGLGLLLLLLLAAVLVTRHHRSRLHHPALAV